MKKFEILRYLKRFSLLIFLVSLAGAAAIYLYADGRQKYTASVIIRYTNDGISDGYTPDGSELDVNEIYSSTVISQAMDALGASGRLSTIRSNISVTPVISEDQQTINDALLQKGEEVTYFPDTYKVSLVVDGEQGAGYARNMLDAIIQSYCTYYTEKYVEQKLSLNPSSGLLDNGYDYYECIRILENGSTTRIFAPPAPATPMQTCAISIPTSKNTPSRRCTPMCSTARRCGTARCCRNIWPTPSKLQSRTNRSPPSSGTVCGA